MKLFISHAIVDKNLAVAFKDLVASVTMGLANTWLSSAVDGLKPGDNLWNEVHQNLSDSDKIIALLTPNSLQRPWVLYESGYVAGNKKANVIPIIFSIAKNDLPLPLSAYVTYSGDDFDDLSQFLTQIISEIAPLPNTLLIESSTTEFLDRIDLIKRDLNKIAKKSLKDSINKKSIRVIDKLKASEIFHKKLADKNVKNIKIISYTNEVESDSINHYRVKGKKNIEVFKRSVIVDLHQQQIINLKRIAQGKTTSFWNKKKKIINSTVRLEEEFKDSEKVTVNHYFYFSAPTTRAYIFDNNEALISFYETKEDIISCKRSIYKGMGDSESIWITRETVYGKQLLDGINEEIKCLRMNSRSWGDEKYLIQNPIVGIGVNKMPILELKFVFFDLDGVLYDTMPYYVQAWKNGLKTVNVIIEDIDVYEQESKSSKLTVVELFKKYLNRLPTDKELELAIGEKNKVLKRLGKPLLMDGALNLIEEVLSSGIGVYVITSSQRENLKEELIIDFKGKIKEENIITGQDVKFGKPNPEPYLIACEKAKCFPTEALVFENSPIGITSACRAGINCIAINSGLLDDSILENHGAATVFKSTKNVSEKWLDIKKSLTQD